MSTQQVRNTEETIITKLSLYTFIQKFYAGQLNQLSESQWKELIGCIKQDSLTLEQESITEGIQTLLNFSTQDLADLQYDFNRLFVGPMELEASPYESTYRSENGAVMQYYTLAVRRFYEDAGLTLVNKNSDPDDHLALELEFICYLLENGLEDEQYMKLYNDFLQKHLFHWVEEHCELVQEKTSNNVIIGMSHILQGMMLVEKC
ncbi:TorD/DmsD family molecular chaperone [Bacillus massiliigorillae]|uniref:TorD/DmsD family molecular chaperone n=1 Tax=Bacillus massiliigorillae TaxID=1243664 RepID=UPI0003AAEE20|nr:molecular chaperone TorD family protein [Bacillus massiliigorillae]